MNCECGLEMKIGDELCPRCGKSHDGQWSAPPTCSTADDMIHRALMRFDELTQALPCECDEYHGFTCPIHSDRQLAHDALKALYSR